VVAIKATPHLDTWIVRKRKPDNVPARYYEAGTPLEKACVYNSIPNACYDPRPNAYCGAVTVEPPCMPSKSVYNSHWGMMRRYYACKKSITYPLHNLMKWIDEYAIMVGKRLRAQYVDVALEGHAKSKTQLEELDYGMSKTRRVMEVAVKAEFYKKPKDPRVIVNAPKFLNLRLRPYIIDLQRSLAVDTCAHSWQVGKKDKASLRLGGLCAIDAKRNDGRTQAFWQSPLIKILEVAYGEDIARECASQLLYPFVTLRGRGVESSVAKIYWPSLGAVPSGSIFTTAINGTKHEACEYCFFRSIGKSPSESEAEMGACYGDDEVFNSLYAARYIEFSDKVGFVKELDDVGPLGMVKFLGRLWDDDRSMKDPGRVLWKIGCYVSTKPRDIAFAEKWAGYYEGDDMPNTPIISHLVSWASKKLDIESFANVVFAGKRGHRTIDVKVELVRSGTPFYADGATPKTAGILAEFESAHDMSAVLVYGKPVRIADKLGSNWAVYKLGQHPDILRDFIQMAEDGLWLPANVPPEWQVAISNHCSTETVWAAWAEEFPQIDLLQVDRDIGRIVEGSDVVNKVLARLDGIARVIINVPGHIITSVNGFKEQHDGAFPKVNITEALQNHLQVMEYVVGHAKSPTMRWFAKQFVNSYPDDVVDLRRIFEYLPTYGLVLDKPVGISTKLDVKSKKAQQSKAVPTTSHKRTTKSGSKKGKSKKPSGKNSVKLSHTSDKPKTK
jgi:hypothetical protein